MLPSVFISHGSPTLPFDDVPARDFLRGLGAKLGMPKAILVASAHWETPAPALNAVAKNSTIHDFYGFPKPLYELRYDASGAPALHWGIEKAAFIVAINPDQAAPIVAGSDAAVLDDGVAVVEELAEIIAARRKRD